MKILERVMYIASLILSILLSRFVALFLKEYHQLRTFKDTNLWHSEDIRYVNNIG